MWWALRSSGCPKYELCKRTRLFVGMSSSLVLEFQARRTWKKWVSKSREAILSRTVEIRSHRTSLMNFTKLSNFFLYRAIYNLSLRRVFFLSTNCIGLSQRARAPIRSFALSAHCGPCRTISDEQQNCWLSYVDAQTGEKYALIFGIARGAWTGWNRLFYTPSDFLLLAIFKKQKSLSTTRVKLFKKEKSKKITEFIFAYA